MATTLLISEAFELHKKGRLRTNRPSPKTEEAYTIACMWLIRKYGDIDICDFTFEHARDWTEWLFGWQSQNTVKNNVVCLRMVLKFVKRSGYEVMDYQDITVPQRAKQVIRYLNEQEIRDFIYEAGKKCRGYSEQSRLRNVAIIELLYATGLRNSELCALDRDTIRNRQLTVSGKSKEPRLVFIDERTEKILEAYLKTRTDTNSALFISYVSGRRINSKILRNIFQTICARSKFKDVHPHTIRHSFATKLLSKNVNLRHIGDLMGHQSLDTTKLYTHYENPQLKEIYDKAHSLI